MSSNMYVDDINSTIIATLQEAERTALIAVAWINFKEYFEVFQALLKKGVKLQIICDDNTSNLFHKRYIESLMQQGASINLISMPSKTNKMHHKFAILDEKTVINGSYNWSKNAELNIENITITRDELLFAAQYIDEFQKISRLTPEQILKLRGKNCCDQEGCNGELINLLVFSPNNSDKYFDAYGDIVSFCHACGEYTTLENCIQDSSLWLEYLGYESLDYDSTEEDKLQIDRDINSYLTNYMDHDITIHGIGVVTHDYNKYIGDEIYTRIIWKNKFHSNTVDDRYEESFGVFYE